MKSGLCLLAVMTLNSAWASKDIKLKCGDDWVGVTATVQAAGSTVEFSGDNYYGFEDSEATTKVITRGGYSMYQLALKDGKGLLRIVLDQGNDVGAVLFYDQASFEMDCSVSRITK